MQTNYNCFTIDVEDWFHILDTAASPEIDDWATLEGRVDIGVNRLLEVLDKYSVKATMFWLGWIAERKEKLLKRCVNAGHEIASHGFAHVLAYEVGPDAFFEDIVKSKKLIEDIIGEEAKGFRAAGFSTTGDTAWVFDKIRKAGYSYDSSVFPAQRGHGGIIKGKLAPYLIDTDFGRLIEIPQSIIELMGKRISLFGGGYLRISPKCMINWGVRKLHSKDRPLIVYVHPREADPEHPRLPMGIKRSFKSYVNLKTTLPKLEMLCSKYKFKKMDELAKQVKKKGG